MNLKKKVKCFLCSLMILSILFFLLGCTKTTQTKNESMTLIYQKQTLHGKFRGTLKNGTPNGDGVFSFHDNGKTFYYKGGFQDGSLCGKGHLKTNLLTIKFRNVLRSGSFEGDVIDCIPNGQGTFTAKNSDGESYTYTGHWKDGMWNGQGTLNVDGYLQNGSFQNGALQSNQ